MVSVEVLFYVVSFDIYNVKSVSCSVFVVFVDVEFVNEG